MITRKTCARCGQTKAIGCFNRDKTSKDSFNRVCRDCFMDYYRKIKHKLINL